MHLDIQFCLYMKIGILCSNTGSSLYSKFFSASIYQIPLLQIYAISKSSFDSSANKFQYCGIWDSFLSFVSREAQNFYMKNLFEFNTHDIYLFLLWYPFSQWTKYIFTCFKRILIPGQLKYLSEMKEQRISVVNHCGIKKNALNF